MDGGNGEIMASDKTASERSTNADIHYSYGYTINLSDSTAWSAEVARARFTINLQRAFIDLCGKLDRAYGQPAGDAADERSQHALALLAIAGFLDRMGPDYLAHFADRLAKLAQALQDRNEGGRVPVLDPPAIASRGDETPIWLARAYVALAVETMRWVTDPRGAGYSRTGYSRKRAAEWAANRCPELERLITERGAHRGDDIKIAIISWCDAFSRKKVKNPAATRVYSEGLSKLNAWALNCNGAQLDQLEAEADKLLQQAVRLV